MAGVLAWRVRWRYVDAAGNLLKQFVEQEADFVVTPITGGDGAMRPDPAELIGSRIPNNFPTPAGASVVLLGISSSQTSTIYL